MKRVLARCELGFFEIVQATEVGGDTVLVIAVAAAVGTVASRPGRTMASVPTLALGFAFA